MGRSAVGFDLVISFCGMKEREVNVSLSYEHMNLKDFIVTLFMALLFFQISIVVESNNPILYIVLGMTGAAGLLQMIEYLKKIRETKNSLKGAKPKILDTSIIIDGRIIEILESGFIEGELIVPKFVLEELQTLSDSSDNIKRARGRRGLDLIKEMQSKGDYVLSIEERDYKGKEVDAKLIKLAKDIKGDILTTDFNLNKVATIQGVKVLNINELGNSLKLVVLPNEELDIELIKKGDRDGQAVGYLSDGTMVVAEDGGRNVGENVTLLVTSVYPTAAGRMIFGRIKK